MGHQVRFFLSPEDVEALEERLRPLGEYVLLLAEGERPAPLIAAKNAVWPKPKGLRGRYIARTSDLADITYRLDEKLGSYFIAELESPVIEVGIWPVRDNQIQMGRLYFSSSSVSESGFKLPKDKDFVGWAKKVLKTAVKGLHREQNSYYLGATAEALRQEGKVELVERISDVTRVYTPDTIILRRDKA